MTTVPSPAMTREDLLEFLREHLSISITTDVSHEWYNAYVNVRASLMLGDDEISASYDSATLPRRQ